MTHDRKPESPPSLITIAATLAREGRGLEAQAVRDAAERLKTSQQSALAWDVLMNGMEAIEFAREFGGDGKCDDRLNGYIAAWTRQKNQIKELEPDAARYRWLREANWIDDSIMESRGIKDFKPETLDAAIDAAKGRGE